MNTLGFGVNTQSAFFPPSPTSLDKKIISNRLYSFLNTCSLKKHLVFLQHTGRCHLFFTFQHLAGWLNLLSESHLMDLHDSQLHTKQPGSSFSSNLSLPLSLSPLISLTVRFALLFLECESWWLIISVFCHLPNLPACLKMKHGACKCLQVKRRCTQCS